MLFNDADFHKALLNNLIYMAFFLTVPIAMGCL